MFHKQACVTHWKTLGFTWNTLALRLVKNEKNLKNRLKTNDKVKKIYFRAVIVLLRRICLLNKKMLLIRSLLTLKW